MSNETACVTRRTKGDGTIFQNKKGRWIARYKSCLLYTSDAADEL